MENNKPQKIIASFTLVREKSSAALERLLRDQYIKILNDDSYDTLRESGYIPIPRETFVRMRVCVYDRVKDNDPDYSTFNYMRECVKKDQDYRLLCSYVDIDCDICTDQIDITEFKKMMERARNNEFSIILTSSISTFIKSFVRFASFEDIRQYILPVYIRSVSEHIEIRLENLCIAFESILIPALRENEVNTLMK